MFYFIFDLIFDSMFTDPPPTAAEPDRRAAGLDGRRDEESARPS